MAETKHEAEKHRVFVYSVLNKAGWILETRKSDEEGDASQIKEYLGFIIDTSSMAVRLGVPKKHQVWETISYGCKALFGGLKRRAYFEE
ncbi:hypothetical protein DAPPUDRAFT_256291 [Daphnia pulex]|uniref:Uncharacterized protein n=1 Tax=Daphnia pulex TaxID=6669 RepID=E9HB21_DAPPU|nr:hypothetical protein DAPPUDRAFT_256291 [Daphnia pulex]|eukprot:EFX71044.1 hypothetical protein DAPPUDRAFT_256291 [Daphnia pulex]